MLKIETILFPSSSQVYVIIVALLANGMSSYRDASSVARITTLKWKATVIIFTDRPGNIALGTPNLSITVQRVKTAKDLLSGIDQYVASLPPICSLLFTISAHGYSTIVPKRVCMEINGRSEYVTIDDQRVMDYELFDALYERMSHGIDSLCLIDTCHSGTMLDLEYMSTDGRSFVRSKTILQPRPFSVCISACSDDELAGEDVSAFGGWGGKLICQFLDRLHSNHHIEVMAFYRRIRQLFTSQSSQASHPVISYNE